MQAEASAKMVDMTAHPKRSYQPSMSTPACALKPSPTQNSLCACVQLSAAQAELLAVRAEADDLKQRLADGHAALNRSVDTACVPCNQAWLLQQQQIRLLAGQLTLLVTTQRVGARHSLSELRQQQLHLSAAASTQFVRVLPVTTATSPEAAVIAA